MKRNEGVVWVPEPVGQPGGYYAQETGDGNSLLRSRIVVTRDIYVAEQFATQAECKDWCDLHPHPRFVPVEHEFADMPPAFVIPKFRHAGRTEAEKTLAALRRIQGRLPDAN